MDKKNNNIAKNIYNNILIALFLISAVIAIGCSIVKQSLGRDYVFHSWLEVTHSVSWVLMIGLILIIAFTYLNVWLGGIIIPFVLGFAFFWGSIGYSKEIRQGEYIITETQQLGEIAIRYYENINIFIMKYHHQEYVR